MSAVVADGQFRDQNQQLLTLAEDLLAEEEYIGKLLTGGICLLFEGLGAAVEVGFQQFEGFRAVGRRLFLQHGSHIFQCCHGTAAGELCVVGKGRCQFSGLDLLFQITGLLLHGSDCVGIGSCQFHADIFQTVQQFCQR